MLTNLLAWSLAIASLGLYLSGFFLPELYRKFDLVASGAGLFFALTLWIYGDRVNGGLLLGTAAGVLLILWFGWQTFQYRWQLTHPSHRTNTQKAQALWQRLQGLLPEGALTQLKDRLQGLLSRTVNKAKEQPLPAAPPTPPMDTSPDMTEDLWSEGQGESTSPPEITSANAPAVTAAPQEPVTPPEPVAKTPAPEATAAPEAPQPSAEPAAEASPTEGEPLETQTSDAEMAASEVTSESEPPQPLAEPTETSEPTAAEASTIEVEPAETQASAADLVSDIPENGEEDSSPRPTDENSGRTPSDAPNHEESEGWPPKGTGLMDA